jgi:hypothetical protein
MITRVTKIALLVAAALALPAPAQAQRGEAYRTDNYPRAV